MASAESPKPKNKKLKSNIKCDILDSHKPQDVADLHNDYNEDVPTSQISCSGSVDLAEYLSQISEPDPTVMTSDTDISTDEWISVICAIIWWKFWYNNTNDT